MENLPRYELLIEDLEDGMTCISLVDDPAIQTNWFAFKKEDEGKLTISLRDEQILTSPIMIPNMDILRIDPAGEKYTIFFSESTIVDMRNKFFQDDLIKKISLMHTDKQIPATLIESWIIQDSNNDKAKAMGFDLPKGTWMGSVKINDDEFWEEMVKSKAVRGFSLEGLFKNKQIFQNLKMMDKDKDKDERGLYEKFADLFRSQEAMDLAREKREVQKDLENSKTNKMLMLSIIESYKIQQFGTSGVIKQRTINLGNGKSAVFNDMAEAKLLDNATFQFSEMKDGMYESENKEFKFEVNKGFGFEDLEAEAEPELAAETTTPEEKKITTKELYIIKDGDAMWLGEDGLIYRQDMTPYPDGEYTTDKEEIIVIKNGQIVEREMNMSANKEFQEMQVQLKSQSKQIEDLTKMSSQLLEALQKNSIAKDIKMPTVIEMQKQPNEQQSKADRIKERVKQFNKPITITNR